jgi:hypothetical protein
MDQLVNEYDKVASLKQPRGRPKGMNNDKPRDINKVIFILQRWKRGASFAQIGTELGITRSGVRLLAKRWENDPLMVGYLAQYQDK